MCVMSVCGVKRDPMTGAWLIIQDNHTAGSISAINGRSDLDIEALARNIVAVQNGEKPKRIMNFTGEIHYRSGPDAVILTVRYGGNNDVRIPIEVARLTGTENLLSPDSMTLTLDSVGARKRAPRRGAARKPSV